MPLLETTGLRPGQGHLVLELAGQAAVFSTLSYTYPLKLISPSNWEKDAKIATVYLVSYGGGLVAGDSVQLSVEVGAGTGLLVLTQGSTKVFKTRRSSSPHSDHSLIQDDTTRQRITTNIGPNATLYLLPAPVTCFARALYSQAQTFNLVESSNLLLFDSYTSGRMGMEGTAPAGPRGLAVGRKGEEWKFDRYKSSNTITVDGRIVLNDVLLLEDEREDDERRGNGPTSYHARVAPYSVYSTIIIYGSNFAPLRASIAAEYAQVVQNQQNMPYNFLWSYSEFDGGAGGIMKCAGDTTEGVKDWTMEILQRGGTEEMLGSDRWKGVCT